MENTDSFLGCRRDILVFLPFFLTIDAFSRKGPLGTMPNAVFYQRGLSTKRRVA